jgi:putative inorganic carbon (HCO3(-)) transporter
MISRSNGGRYPFFQNVFVNQKLNNVFGYVVVGLISVLFAWLLATKTLVGLGLFGGVIALALVLACLVNTEWGLYINIIYAFFAFHLSRFFFNDAFPVGVVTDALIFSTFLGLFIRNVNLKASFSEFMRSGVIIWMLVLVFYLLIEMFNPNGHTFEGWFQGFRRFLVSVFLLFVSYQVFDQYQKIVNYVKVIFVLCVITGLYACVQQWHGLFNFELNWVMSDENRFGLYFINGNFRKFSTMSDPTAFGVVMASCSVFFIILGIHQRKANLRLLLFAGSLIMLMGMAYSGTRTANVMVAAGIAMYILLTFNRKSTKIFALGMVLLFGFLMYVPIYDNYTLNRFRTSFSASKDESFLVRERNRNYIQPLIHSHPIGFGMGTVGGGGAKYAPNHFLAGFPPDSGYLKKAIETGWIGLFIVCMLYFVIMRTAIQTYFRARHALFKILLSAVAASLFSFFVAEFPQEAIGQITDIMIYYPFIAIVLNLKYFEARRNAAKLSANEQETR